MSEQPYGERIYARMRAVVAAEEARGKHTPAGELLHELLVAYDRAHEPEDTFRYEPNLADPAQAAVHRAMETIKRAFIAEYGDEPQTPNLTVVASVPPDGRVGIATTEPSPELCLEALQAGWGATHRALRLGGPS
jgi:hypothetical protein